VLWIVTTVSRPESAQHPRTPTRGPTTHFSHTAAASNAASTFYQLRCAPLTHRVVLFRPRFRVRSVLHNPFFYPVCCTLSPDHSKQFYRCHTPCLRTKHFYQFYQVRHTLSSDLTTPGLTTPCLRTKSRRSSSLLCRDAQIQNLLHHQIETCCRRLVDLKSQNSTL
jgi:hypothetical protein